MNNSLDSLLENPWENNFYHLSQKINANVLDLFRNKNLFPLTTGTPLDNSKKDYVAKMKFKIQRLIVQSVIKIMSMFLTFETFLKWTMGNIIMICI